MHYIYATDESIKDETLTIIISRKVIMTKQQVIARQIANYKKRQVNIIKPDTTKQDLKIAELHINNPFFKRGYNV